MAVNVAVRVAKPGDENPVSAMLQACYPVLMRPSYDEGILAAALPLMTQANPALLSSGTFYLAESDDGRVADCGGWKREQPWSGVVEPEFAHIRHFAVHPDWVRRGVGRAIYRHCEVAARLAGVYDALNATPASIRKVSTQRSVSNRCAW